MVEIPVGTTVLQETALNRLSSDNYSTHTFFDQCAHGARQLPHDLPIKRRTMLLVHGPSPPALLHTALVCPGKAVHPKHAAQGGAIAGWSAELPSKLVTALVADMLAHNRASKLNMFVVDPLGVEDFHALHVHPQEVFWKCKMCQHGKTQHGVPHGEEHTRQPGCKHYKPPPRTARARGEIAPPPGFEPDVSDPTAASSTTGLPDEAGAGDEEQDLPPQPRALGAADFRQPPRQPPEPTTPRPTTT